MCRDFQEIATRGFRGSFLLERRQHREKWLASLERAHTKLKLTACQDFFLRAQEKVYSSGRVDVRAGRMLLVIRQQQSAVSEGADADSLNSSEALVALTPAST